MRESGKILTAMDTEGVLPRVPFWGMMAIAAGFVFLAGFAAHGFNDNGLRFGSQLTWRFAALVYFAAVIAGPLARLLPWPALKRLLAERRQLIWSFCASIGVFLASLVVPNTLTPPSLDHEGLTIGMAFFVFFGAGLTIVVAYTAAPQPNLGEQARRAMLGVGMAYFWLAYTLTGLSHLSGPHRPDGFYGFSLMLMVTALLLRFADRLVANMKARNA
jgi:hypothetical protein